MNDMDRGRGSFLPETPRGHNGLCQNTRHDLGRGCGKPMRPGKTERDKYVTGAWAKRLHNQRARAEANRG